MSHIKIQQPVIHTPSFKEYDISGKELQAKLEAIGLELPVRRLDSRYYYVSHEDWGIIFKDILQNMPRFVSEKWDCDDFSFLTKARVGEKYQINAIGAVIGDSPMGRHAWCLFFSEVGLFYLEPQNGIVYSVEENSGYKGDLIII